MSKGPIQEFRARRDVACARSSVRGSSALWLALLTAGALSGCSVILDFDGLTGGGVTEDGGGGSGGGDDDGRDDCEEEDGDLCTIPRRNANGRCEERPMQCDTVANECMENRCVDGECVAGPVEGLQALGEPRVVKADRMFRSTTQPTANGFVVAAFGEFDGISDINLSYLEYAEAWQQPSRIDGLASSFGNDVRGIAAAPAMILNDAIAPRQLELYFPILSNCEAYSQMVRVRLPPDLRLTADTPPVSADLTTQPNFLAADPRVGPAAGRARGDDPFVAWTGGNGSCDDPTPSGRGIYLHAGESSTSVAAGPSIAIARELTGLAALSEGNGGRGVVWSVNAPARRGTEVFARFFGLAGEAAPVFACALPQGATSEQLSAAPVHIDSLDAWAVSWSHRDASGDLTSASALYPGDGQNSCPYQEDLQPGAEDGPSSGAFTTSALVSAEGDTRIIDLIGLSVRPARDSNNEAVVEARVLRVEIAPGVTPRETGFGRAVELARVPLDRAPDWPELAVSEQGYIAASWLQRSGGEDDDGEELRTQQLKLCR